MSRVAHRSRNFWLLWSSQSVSLLGLQFGMVALPLVAVLTLHASAAQIGLLSVLNFVPWLTIGLFAGGLVARIPRRRVLMIAHSGRAIGVAMIPALWIANLLSMPWLYGIALVNGSLTVFFEVAYHAYLPEVVDIVDLDRSNGRLAVTDGTARAIGPAVAGWLVELISAPLTLLVQAATFASAALLILRIRRPGDDTALDEEAQSSTPSRPQLGSGIRALLADRTVFALVVCDALYLFGFSLASVAVVVFYARTLGLAAGQIGLIFAAGSLGGIAAGLLAPSLRRRLKEQPTMIMAAGLRVAGLAMIGAMALAGPAALLVGAGARLLNAFGWTLFDVHRWTLQQSRIAEQDRSRTTATSLYIAHAGQTVGALAGTMIATSDSAITVIIIGVACSALSVIVPIGTRVRRQPGTRVRP